MFSSIVPSSSRFSPAASGLLEPGASSRSPVDTLCQVEKRRSVSQDLSSPTVETTKEEIGTVGSPLRQPDELLAAPDDYVLGNTLNDRI
jgi:hypothetical protein